MNQELTAQQQYSNALQNQELNEGLSHDETSQIEKDKQLIKTHPLFVLLELLFEKCERATRGEEIPSSNAYDDDIQKFVRQHETIMTSIFIDNPEIDNLMIKAIQVLRIHLLELEKVNELCKDFCHRYITCLKGKMHSENLLRSDMANFELNPQHSFGPNGHSMANTPNANVTVNQQGELVMQGNSVYQQDGLLNDSSIDGSTPLSQVGVSPPHQQQHSLQGLNSQQLYHLQHSSLEESGRKNKRGVLPKHATEILRSWLFSHIVHPYPTEDEKRTLASQTNLTLLQVNNWFINARRRILQPMLDASNPDASAPNSGSKPKKARPQSSRPTDRFWPISGAQPHEEGAPSNHDDPNNNGHALPSTNQDSFGGNSPNLEPTTRLHHYSEGLGQGGVLSMVNN